MNENVMPENLQHARETLEVLVAEAISGDVLTDTGSGFVAVMAQSKPWVLQDIAPAFEVYSLLSHFLRHLPLRLCALDAEAVPMEASVLFDDDNGRLVVLMPVPPGQIDLVAHWVADSIPSPKLKAFGGLLALPFSLETHDGKRHLIPEWFAAFFVDGSPDHCIPVLTLKSVTRDGRFGDWVNVALERMQAFGLPSTAARTATKMERSGC